jgi:hypothetical protein
VIACLEDGVDAAAITVVTEGGQGARTGFYPIVGKRSALVDRFNDVVKIDVLAAVT